MLTLELTGVEIDHCTDCGGIWLDAGELELLLGDSEHARQLIHSFKIDTACSLSFLSGFLAGGAEAFSQANTTTVTGYGQTSTNVTGNTGKYSMFSGLANSAQGMSSYYQKQLEAMIPAVKIEAGKKAVLVIQKGVQIEGLEVTSSNFGSLDD